MRDLELMLRDLGERLDAIYPDPDPHVIMTRRPGAIQLFERPAAPPIPPPDQPQPGPPRGPRTGWRRRPVWVAMVAAVVALALIGVVPLIIEGLRDDIEPSEPSTTTTLAPEETTTSLAPETTTTVPTPILPPPVAATDVWLRVPHDDGVFGGPEDEVALFDVTAGGPGLVAAGMWNDNVSRNAAFWVSPDGSSWERVPHDPAVFGDAAAQKVVATSYGLVAAGWSPAGTVMWNSRDAVSWTRSGPAEVLAAANHYALGARGNRVVAAGSCSGSCPVRFFYTDDGESWQEAALDDPDAAGAHVLSVAAAPDGFLAIGSAATTAGGRIWLSPDGTTWTRVEDPLWADPAAQISLRRAAHTATGWVMLGHFLGPGDDSDRTRIFTSPDGVLWAAADAGELLGRSVVDNLVGVGSGVLALGADRDGAAVWYSDDGAAWDRLEVRDGHDGYADTASVIGGATVVVGQQELERHVVGAVWRLVPDSEAPPLPEPPPAPTVPSAGWARVDLPDEFAGEGRLYEVAPGGPGVVALGFRTEADGSRTRIAATSPDGLTWDLSGTLEGDAVPASVAAAGPGLVAAGWEDADNWYGANAVFWHSSDGFAWTRVPHDDAVFGDAEAYDVVAGGPGVVAVGDATVEDPPFPQFTDEGTAIWVSSDGITFDHSAELAEVDAVGIWPLEDRLVLAGHRIDLDPAPISFWSSTDGVDWTEEYTEQAPQTRTHYVVLGGTPDEVRLLAGDLNDATVMTWTVSGGQTSRVDVQIPDMGRVRSVTMGRPGWVAVGVGLDESPAVWVSADGLDWARVADDGSLFGTGIGVIDVVPLGPNIVAVGSFDDGGVERPAIWMWQPAT